MVPFRVLSRINLADRCSSNFSTSSISFASFGLRTLFLSLRSFSDSRPLFSTTSALFLQNTRGCGYPSTFPASFAPSIPCGLSRLRILPVTTGLPTMVGVYPYVLQTSLGLWPIPLARPLFHITLPRSARGTNPFSRLPAMAGLSAEAGKPFIFTSASGKPHP